MIKIILQFDVFTNIIHIIKISFIIKYSKFLFTIELHYNPTKIAKFITIAIIFTIIVMMIITMRYYYCH
jgi:hypothetical protein